MKFDRYLVLVENMLTGDFVQVGSTSSMATVENSRMLVEKLNAMLDKPLILIWVKDQETGEVF